MSRFAVQIICLSMISSLVLIAYLCDRDLDRPTTPPAISNVKTIVEPVFRVPKCGSCGKTLVCPECHAFVSANPAIVPPNHAIVSPPDFAPWDAPGQVIYPGTFPSLGTGQ